MVSVIMCVYNTRPIVQKCIEACLETLEPCHQPWELLLVNNHSTDRDTTKYLSELVQKPTMPKRVVVFDPGKNLGCHNGWNYGLARSCASLHDYVVKLDDDTEMQTPGWADIMSRALELVPGCAYVSSDIDAKQQQNYELRKFAGDVELEVATELIVGFSCVMFRYSWVRLVGPMKTIGFIAANGKQSTEQSLYGGEEGYYRHIARMRGEMIAHIPAVFAHHHDNEERDQLYVLWKWFGFLGWIEPGVDTVGWRDTGKWIEDCEQAILDFEAGKLPPGADTEKYIAIAKEGLAAWKEQQSGTPSEKAS